ncbi:hypothetical protein [Micromonospora tarensis]|uniref:Uncharacterized protein n=1 Tax=Micromonospora tarensis TaxID=2806100 RepID=A0ABS1YCP6_9ACTN|nr:hypothetical protein [Micromonospora tarensis]MBM0275143.1 hypothetical protein [Micromonospora tarensis]
MSEQTTHPTKPISELVRGEFVHHRRHTTEVDTGTVCKVEAVVPFRDGDGHQMVSTLLVPLAGGEPRIAKHYATHEIFMATEDDVAAAQDQVRRGQLQDDLVALQGLLSSLRVRPDGYQGAFDIAVVDGEVSRIAEALGLPAVDFGSRMNQAVKWTAPGDEDLGMRLTVRFWGKPAELPAVADADEPEHRHVGGAAGGPGENDAQCACGVTYAGFDTHAEAMKMLDAHIADEQSGR